MRTSPYQFEMLVSFMELNGDLCKPSLSAMGRVKNQKLWEELRKILNDDPMGDTRSVEKWKKVWSDFKLNTKKKAARINQCQKGTGGGPAIKIILTDLESRVLSIIGVQAATGLRNITEAGLPLIAEATATESPSLNIQLAPEQSRDAAPSHLEMAETTSSNIQLSEPSNYSDETTIWIEAESSEELGDVFAASGSQLHLSQHEQTSQTIASPPAIESPLLQNTTQHEHTSQTIAPPPVIESPLLQNTTQHEHTSQTMAPPPAIESPPLLRSTTQHEHTSQTMAPPPAIESPPLLRSTTQHEHTRGTMAPPPAIESPPLLRNTTHNHSPEASPAAGARLASTARRRLISPRRRQERGHGRPSPYRRREHRSIADEFLRADAAHRDFERERWALEIQREQNQNAYREREINLREAEVETSRRWQEIAHKALDIFKHYLDKR